MKKLTGLLLLVLSIALLSCGSKDPVLGSINKKEITLSQFKNKLIKEYGFTENQLKVDRKVRGMFINLYMADAFLKEGTEKGFFKKPETIKALEQLKRKLYSSQIGPILWKKEIEPRLKNIPDALLKPFTKQVKVSHILISTKNKDPKKVLKLANDIRAKLKKGASFKELAAKYSDDPGSKNKGGNLGWISKVTPFIKPFLDAVFSSQYKKGDITKPVKSIYGYHIIYLEDEKNMSIDEIKKNKALMKRIEKQNQQKVVMGYIMELRKKYASKIHIHMDLLKDAKKNLDKDLVAVDGINSIKVKVFYDLINTQLPQFKNQPQKLKSYIQNRIVDGWLVYLEALSLGLDKDPQVIKKTKFKWIVEQGRAYRNYVRTQFVNQVTVNEEKLKDYYKTNIDRFSKTDRTPFAYEEIKDKVKTAYLKTFPKKQNPTEEELKKYYQMNVPKFGFKSQKKVPLPYERVAHWVKQDYVAKAIRPLMTKNRKRIMKKYEIEFKKQK